MKTSFVPIRPPYEDEPSFKNSATSNSSSSLKDTEPVPNEKYNKNKKNTATSYKEEDGNYLKKSTVEVSSHNVLTREYWTKLIFKFV